MNAASRYASDCRRCGFTVETVAPTPGKRRTQYKLHLTGQHSGLTQSQLKEEADKMLRGERGF